MRTMHVYWDRTGTFFLESHALGAAQALHYASVLSASAMGDVILTVVQVPAEHLAYTKGELNDDDRVVSYCEVAGE